MRSSILLFNLLMTFTISNMWIFIKWFVELPLNYNLPNLIFYTIKVEGFLYFHIHCIFYLMINTPHLHSLSLLRWLNLVNKMFFTLAIITQLTSICGMNRSRMSHFEDILEILQRTGQKQIKFLRMYHAVISISLKIWNLILK